MAEGWQKYRRFPHVDLPDRTWPSKVLTHAPLWVSVDLRDGNQALIEPMGVAEKLEMFDLLVRLGLKEIEVAFPSASETEFEFVRTLIEKKLIPDDVTIQVLTQAREGLIRRTFEAIAGAKQAIVHLYNSTSILQRRVVFGMNEDQIVDLAVQGTKLIKELTQTVPETKIRFEYSPESFTGTELEFALRICEEVSDIWEPTTEDKIILNLPATVEMSTPNVYADQIEWMGRHLKRRDCTLISLHTHNDRGCAVAAAELGQMAGADRVEGTIFGYGERTGNVDLVTLALNLHAHGIDPLLDLHDLPSIVQTVQKCTDNPIHPRHPYVGELVFTAFSGSHQDAISKGMRSIDANPSALFEVPYLTIDPHDIGRSYEAIIRVNSQSGKGGVAYILRMEKGLDLPKAMQPEFAAVVQKRAEQTGSEVPAEAIWGLFQETYLGTSEALDLVTYHISSSTSSHEGVECEAEVSIGGVHQTIHGHGRGPVDAFAHALASAGIKPFDVLSFHEHSVGFGTEAMAAAYVQIKRGDVNRFGVGIDENITRATLIAVLSALRNLG